MNGIQALVLAAFPFFPFETVFIAPFHIISFKFEKTLLITFQVCTLYECLGVYAVLDVVVFLLDGLLFCPLPSAASDRPFPQRALQMRPKYATL